MEISRGVRECKDVCFSFAEYGVLAGWNKHDGNFFFGFFGERIDYRSGNGKGIDNVAGGKNVAIIQQGISFIEIADGLSEVYGISGIFVKGVGHRDLDRFSFHPRIQWLVEITRYTDFGIRVGQLDELVKFNDYFFGVEIPGQVWRCLSEYGWWNGVFRSALRLLNTRTLPGKQNKY